jgi:glycosyltransferase involved in cell wall biosynthesis
VTSNRAWATTLRYPQRDQWASSVECLTLDRPGSVLRGVRVVRAARRGHPLVLDGSGRADQVAAAVAARVAPRTPILLTDCTWETGSGAVDRLLSRSGVRLLDRPNVVFSVGSKAESVVFPHTWGLPRKRVTWASWYHGVPDGDELSDVRHDGPVFAGGRSVRDYRPFLEAMAQVEVPCVVSAPSSALPENVPIPPWVEVDELDPDAYDRALRAASVVVVPLQHREDRAAGQSTYLTAMALGKLVIVVDSLAVREHVIDGVTGLVVDADPAALAEDLRWALDPANAAEVEAIRAAARTHATTRFSPEAHISRLLEITRALPTADHHRSSAAGSAPVSRRVAMVEFPPSGGLFQFSVQLGEALARRGHRVDLITGPRPELRSRAAGCRVRGVLPTWHPHAGSGRTGVLRRARRAVRALRHVAAWCQLVLMLAVSRPDVVMWSAWRFPVDGWGVRVVRRLLPGAELAIVAHEPRPLVEQPGEAGQTYRDTGLLHAALAGAYAAVDHVYVLGEETRKVLTDTWSTDASVTVVPHGDERIYPPESVRAVSETGPVVLAFGTITAYKGIDVLLTAWPLVSEQVPGAELRVVGPLGADVDGDALHQAAAAVGARVREGYVAVEDVPQVFDAARVVALPYLRSSQSGVAHLAHTLGRPVVASRVGDIPTVVVHGESGLLVEPGEATGLASALVRLLTDPELAQRLGSGGQDALVGNASWDDVAALVDAPWGRA